jgi:hypothetical protein
MRPMPTSQIAPKGPWPEGLLPIDCPQCRLPLCIHRPDPASPRRLEGTCQGCLARRAPASYVIEWTPDGAEVTVGLLPEGFVGRGPIPPAQAPAGSPEPSERRAERPGAIRPVGRTEGADGTYRYDPLPSAPAPVSAGSRRSVPEVGRRDGG